MSAVRMCAPKTQSDLNTEWDHLAEERHRQIVSGEDLSFDHVVVPTMFGLLEGANTKFVVDVGSGTGDFSARLAHLAARVTGIEPSHVSVSLAKATYGNVQNLDFAETSLQQATQSIEARPATAATACMVLMTTPDITGFAKSLTRLLMPGAKFVASLTHPCFWPRYWGYEAEPWFNYSSEIFIEAPFAISARRTNVKTTHIHRPLHRYMTAFADQGFRLEAVAEPFPSPEVQALYPQPWQFPRFLVIRWSKDAQPTES